MTAPSRFVGRQRELAAITGLIDHARRESRPVVATLVGEPGSGKTRLLREALGRTRGATVVRMTGFEPTRAIPLTAAGDLLRVLGAVPGVGEDVLRLAFDPGATAPSDPLRLFEATHRALRGHGRIILGVDDLQWLDSQSIALLDFLLRAAATAGGPLPIVVAGRPSSDVSAATSAFEQAVGSDHAVALVLEPLEREAGVELARAVDSSLSLETAGEVWRRAQGSPFWIEALARVDQRAQNRDVLDDRLLGLGADAGSLLGMLAVLGRPIAADDVSELVDWPPERTTFALRELATRGLVVHAGPAVRVAHDLIREAVTRGLPAEALRRIHARAGTWLEVAGRDDVQLLVEALGHRRAAGHDGIDLAGRIATADDRRRLDVRSLRLLAEVADAARPDDARRLPLDRAIATLATDVGEPALAIDRWRRVDDGTADPQLRALAAIESARAAYALDRPGDVHVHLDRAATLVEPGSASSLQVEALRALTRLWLDHDTAAGAANAARALGAADDMIANAGGAERLTPVGRTAVLEALEAASDAALQQDRGLDVLDLGERTMAIARRLGAEAYVSALLRTGFALRPLGRIRDSVARYEEAWLLARRLVLPLATVDAGHGLARGLRDLGRPGEARAIAQETAALEARLQTAPRRWGTASTILHSIELVSGDGLRGLEQLRQDARVEPDPHFRIGIHQTIAAWVARTAGSREADAVRRELSAAQRSSAVAGCPRCAMELRFTTAECLARIGDVDDARAELVPMATVSTPAYLQRDLWKRRAEAWIAVAGGDREGAVDAFRDLARDLEAAELREDLVWAYLDLGRVLGRGTEAVTASAAAADLAEECGLSSLARVARQELRRLGVRAWRRGPGGPGTGLGALSAREREIAQLVAAGRTNREIGDGLAVSPRTVERHVTNILAKLGLRNRVELSAHVQGAAHGSESDGPLAGPEGAPVRGRTGLPAVRGSPDEHAS